MERKPISEKLKMWQDRLAANEKDYQNQLDRMDEREALYRGSDQLKPLTPRDAGGSGGRLTTPHVRNIVAENIESAVSSAIPQPKVTARRKKDERLAKLIEDMLRNELDRLPMEYLNDQQERTVPIQGGGFFHVEWDNSQRSPGAVGEVTISLRHPKQVIPQAGVYTSIEDMDYIILKLPQTKRAIRRRYGVDMLDEGEGEPEVRGISSGSFQDSPGMARVIGGCAANDRSGGLPAADMVTQYVAYYRNDKGGIGLYSWVNDTQLEDIADYQARRLRRCAHCGEIEPEDGSGVCLRCGGRKWTDREEEFQELWEPVTRSDGSVIPGALPAIDPENPLMARMEPTRVPYYKPGVYPLVLQRNVSVFGQLLGESDADKIADQQNTVNRMEKKIIDRLVKAGSRIILPPNAGIRMDPEDNEIIHLRDAVDANMIQVKDFSGNLQYELAFLSQVYEEARQTLGITDSFQGRRDATAQSGKAKEFAAAQSAGRMESKRVLKDAAYADLFRLIFQFKLAYAGEPRPVVSRDSRGETVYGEFNRWDFLEQGEDGTWRWNDQFLFSTDTSAPLANNRERMWEETVSLFSAGCFGNPQDPETLIALWTKLELLHYPGAGDTRKYLEERLETQQAAMMEQRAGGASAARAVVAATGGNDASQGPIASQAVPQEIMAAVEGQAQQDALAAVMNQ